MKWIEITKESHFDSIQLNSGMIDEWIRYDCDCDCDVWKMTLVIESFDALQIHDDRSVRQIQF